MPRKAKKRGSGQGSIWVQGGNTWIRWRQNGQRRTRKFPGCDGEVRKTAERALAVALLDLAAGRAGLEVEGAPAPSLSELATKWLDRREHTHRAWRGDKNLWTKHLKPTFGHLQPADVDHASIRRLIEVKLGEGLSAQSVGNIVRLLSTLYTDIIEQGFAQANPARALPRSTRRLIKSTHDPKQTAFIEKQGDIARIYSKLAQPFATMFAVGALAGLRPGEIIGLQWGDVDLDAGRMLVQRQVRQGKLGPTKNGKPRLVPIIGPLSKILAEWKLATGGDGLIFKPLTPWRRRSKFIKDSSMREALRGAFEACGLPATWTWYTVSRHTYASQHVMGGGSLATLREILGHSSVTVTERYAHLNPGLFKAEDLLKLSVSLTREGGAVVDLAAARAEKRGTLDHGVTTDAVDEGGEEGVSTDAR
jgi:integrase